MLSLTDAQILGLSKCDSKFANLTFERLMSTTYPLWPGVDVPLYSYHCSCGNAAIRCGYPAPKVECLKCGKQMVLDAAAKITKMRTWYKTQ